MKNKIKVLYISAIPLEPTYGGCVIMHKLLADNEAVEVLAFGSADFNDCENYSGLIGFFNRLLFRLERTRSNPFFEAVRTFSLDG